MVVEKKTLSCLGIESQTALELPDRETLGWVTIGNVLSGNHINIQVRDVFVANQICTQVSAINVLVDNDQQLWCSFQENPPPPPCDP